MLGILTRQSFRDKTSPFQRHAEDAAVGLHSPERGAASPFVLRIAFSEEGGFSLEEVCLVPESQGTLDQLGIRQGSNNRAARSEVLPSFLVRTWRTVRASPKACPSRNAVSVSVASITSTPCAGCSNLPRSPVVFEPPLPLLVLDLAVGVLKSSAAATAAITRIVGWGASTLCSVTIRSCSASDHAAMSKCCGSSWSPTCRSKTQ